MTLRRLLPGTLAGQTTLLLAAGLAGSLALSLIIYASDRSEAVHAAGGRQIALRVAALAHLIEESPEPWWPRILQSVNGPTLRVELAREPAPGGGGGTGDARAVLVHAALARLLAEDGRERRIAVNLSEIAAEERLAGRPGPGAMRAGGPPFGPGFGPGMHRGMARAMQAGLTLPAVAISVELANGWWLNAESAVPEPPPLWSSGAALSLALLAAAVIALSLIVVRRITRPIAALAGAARRLGTDVAAPPLAETGPIEVRTAARAFNDMQERLKRFVEDRTRMLAAISHDLRTPITALKLRLEFVEDSGERAKMLATLSEMEAMIAATLSFARDDAAKEERRAVDLAALLRSLCDDLADQGLDVALEAPARLAYACRPLALKRAVANLIDNALKYGARARVRLEEAGGGARITIDDSGPGIEEGRLEEVFRPFFRLEGSRSRETGGVGLGLSVARTIVHAHGGELRLANRPEGGLRATLTLPRATSD